MTNWSVMMTKVMQDHLRRHFKILNSKSRDQSDQVPHYLYVQEL